MESSENERFEDIEAQTSSESPLLGRSPPAPAAQGSSSNFNPREALFRAFWFLSSIEAFKSRGINSSSSRSPACSTSRSSSSSSLTHHIASSPDDQNSTSSTHDQSIEIVEEDTSQDDASTSGSTSTTTAITSFTRQDINNIVREKNLQLLRDIGGVQRVKQLLQPHTASASPPTYPHNPTHPCTPHFLATAFHSLREAINRITIFLLIVAASLSLAFGIQEDGAVHPLGWLNGAVLFSTTFLVVICTTTKNCWDKLSVQKSENLWRSRGRNMQVRVVRGERIVDVHESGLEVGDIAILRKGDHVPADGLFDSGQPLEIDKGLSKPATVDAEHNPFLHYGWRVINGGEARMLVTSVRMETAWGERMSQATKEAAENECHFEYLLYKWSNYANIVGICLAILLLIVVFLRYKWGKLDDERRYRPDSKGEPIRASTIMNAIKEVFFGCKGTARVLTTLLSVSLIGVTEGIGFVVSAAIILWGRVILAHRALERDFAASLKMASLTAICTDKFGGLTTEDGMEIDRLYLGGELISESSVVASNVLECLFDGISVQSLPELRGDSDTKLMPLVSWAEARLGMKSQTVVEHCREIRNRRGDNPLQGCCQVVIEKNEGCYIHCGGPLEEILQRCSHQYLMNGQPEEMDQGRKSRLEEISEGMKSEEAQVIAYAYKRLDNTLDDEASARNLIFVGMISMKETKPDDTKLAVSTLRDSGVQMIILSGDNPAELRAIGERCGILSDNPGSMEVLDAEVFRGWTDAEKMKNADKIRMMGNCRPSDKTDWIKCARKNGQVVGFMGQRAMDAPSLKQADVGIAVGTWSSTVARESCDICVWEGNCIRFLIDVIQKARCFEENIRKLVQLQLTFTCSSSLINFAAVVFMGDAPMNAAEVFWLNLAIPLGGGLALLTGPLTKAPTSIVPMNSSEKVISKAMWRNMAIQVLYLTAIFLTLQHRGHVILKGISGGSLKSMIYNGFFICQMFITLTCRELEKKNIFRGVCHENKWFWAGLILILICQAVSAGGERVFGSIPGLSWEHWGWCLVIGFGCVVMDWVGKIAHSLISLLGRKLIGSWERLEH